MSSASLNIVKKSREAQWKTELAESVSSPTELLKTLGLDNNLSQTSIETNFRLRVPRAYIKKMHKGDPNDPLLLQVLPQLKENDGTGYKDPVGDINAMMTPGLLHKYHGRALLITTGACAIHCRYCFRRHFPYSENSSQQTNWQQALHYLDTHPEIQEVILSGGDPLVLDDDKLANLCKQLETIEHLKWLRIHTRLPVVLPSRITESLIQWMKNSRFRITMVIHANHAQEIGDDEKLGLQKIATAGISLLNQSVLLNNINDDAATLIDLSKRLHDTGVLPYYLHLLDPVEGATHFDVRPGKACKIIEKMREMLPGYLVPQLVREERGASAKTAIFGI